MSAPGRAKVTRSVPDTFFEITVFEINFEKVFEIPVSTIFEAKTP
jgi:hypothetical protein